jgi:LysM repeat protein
MLVLATGCFRPAAPDVTPTPAGGAEGATPGEPDLEATAKANSTQAARTLEAQTAETGTPEEGQQEEEEEPVATSTEPPATATSEPVAATVTPAPTVYPTTAAPTAVPTATEVPTAGETTYVVQPGDNLFRIAMRYGTTWEAIAQANGITDVRQVYVGQELVIPTDAQPSQPSPGGTTYVVKPGDNLFRIALRYNMDYRRLAAYNGIGNPSNIYVGQVLRIPPQ